MKNGIPPNNVILFPGETAVDVEEEAVEWLVLLNSGACTPRDMTGLALWRAASPDHDRVFREVERLWSSIGAVGSPPLRLIRRDVAWGLRAAAALLCLLSLSLFGRYLAEWRYDYQTAPGQIRTVVLADGSTVSLKGDTALNVRFAENGRRQVHLARGEAYFEVVHNPVRPFIVDMGTGSAIDLGTGFSVARHGQTGEVSVDHGRVEVVADGRSQTLSRGEGINFGSYYLGRKAQVDTGLTLAWRRGLYFAENKPLGDVVHDLNAYLPGKMLIVDDRLRDRRINAGVQLADVGAWLDALNRIPGVSVRKIGPLIVIGRGAV